MLRPVEGAPPAVGACPSSALPWTVVRAEFRGERSPQQDPLRWAVRPRAGTWEASDASSLSSPSPGVVDKWLTLVTLHVLPTCLSLSSRLGCQMGHLSFAVLVFTSPLR